MENRHLIWLIFVNYVLLTTVESQSGQSCVDDLTRSNPLVGVRFSHAQLSTMCARHDDWLQSALKVVGKAAKRLLTARQTDFLNVFSACEDVLCLCKLGGVSNLCDSVVSQITGPIDMLRPENRRVVTGVGTISGVPLPFGNNNKPDGEFGGFDLDFFPTENTREKRQSRRKLSRVIRKEYRMLSESERDRFHAAMNASKYDMIDGLSKYDILIVHHTPEYSPGAHFGPALLPFHRELLKQLELLLRSYDPEVALPYWDSTLDNALPDARDGVLWTEHFFGNGDGAVTTGPFSRWRTHKDDTMPHLDTQRRIIRNIGASPMGGLYSNQDIIEIMSRATFEDLTYCVDPFFELVHGTVHMWIGGHMGTLRVSPNDPTFFLLHSFIDMIWEEWRQMRQSRDERATAYPTDARACSTFHHADADMRPWRPLKNQDGLANRYTDVFYGYANRPTCSHSRPSCGGSKYLFCDMRLPGSERCLSKVQVNGNCTGFAGTDICFGGSCVSGRCKALPSTGGGNRNWPHPAPTTRRPTTTTRRHQPAARTTRTAATRAPETTRRTTPRRTTPRRTTRREPTTTMRTTTTQRRTTSNRWRFTATFFTKIVRPWQTTTQRPPQTTTRKAVTRRRVTIIRTFPTRRPGVRNPFDRFRTLVPRQTTTEATTTRRSPVQTTPRRQTTPSQKTVWFPITVLSAKGGAIKEFTAGKILAEDSDGMMLPGRFANRDQQPFYYGSAYAQVTSPFAAGGRSRSTVYVLDERSQHCVSMCLDNSQTRTPWRYSPCVADVVLDVDPRRSDNIPFTPDVDRARFLNWREERKLPDPFLFMCHATAIKTPTKRPDRVVGSVRQITVSQRLPWTQRTTPATTKTPPHVISIGTKKTKGATKSCSNEHRCCSLWANAGECMRNAWMREACQKSCFVCNAGPVVECSDQHAECATWEKEGQCLSNDVWMEENCPRSCRVCHRPSGSLARLCGEAEANTGECKDHDGDCPGWARGGECKANPWWMKSNCPKSCNAC